MLEFLVEERAREGGEGDEEELEEYSRYLLLQSRTRTLSLHQANYLCQFRFQEAFRDSFEFLMELKSPVRS